MGYSIDVRNIEGKRHYIATDENGTEFVLPGVTSIKGVIPADHLLGWYAKEAGVLAVKSISHLQDMAAYDKQGAIDWVKGAARRYGNRRSDIGSAAHTMFEILMNGEERIPIAEAIAGNDKLAKLLDDEEALAEAEAMTDHFEQFLDAVKPELVHAEDVALSTTHGYAGSFDAILKVKVNPKTGKADPVNGVEKLMVVDWKTGKSIYPDVGLQLTAYAYADQIVDPDGNAVDMPKIDSGAVLHVTAKTWVFKELEVSDELLGMFLDCLEFFKAVKRWEGVGRGIHRTAGLKDNVIRDALARKARGAFKTGTERRA